MNWNEIKENYPKAWDKLDEWISYHQQLGYDFIYKAWVDEYQSHYNIFRDLYDFFDEQGICIGLCVTMHQFKEKTQYYADFCIDNFLAFETENQDTRTEAEE